MPPVDAQGLSRRTRLSRLALRTAAPPAAAAALVTALLLLFTGNTTLWIGLIAGLVTGLSVYATVRNVVTNRLTLAQATLREARKRKFDRLSSVQVERRDDELDEMLWQVYQAGRVLQQEIERLEKLEHYRRDFVGNVSHELKTPIFVIGGFAEQLLAGALEDPKVNRRFAEKILRNAHRLQQLSQDLIAISRLESGETAVQLRPLAIRALAVEVLDALEPIAEPKRVTLRASIPPDLPHVVGDRELLRQVLSNLVDNAIKYSNEGGRVEISAHVIRDEKGAAVNVEVADDGIGIPPEAIPRITERFYRVDRSRSRQQGGTGLGLAIVKHILEAHDARLHVESRVGEGSAFGFVLRADAADN